MPLLNSFRRRTSRILNFHRNRYRTWDNPDCSAIAVVAGGHRPQRLRRWFTHSGGWVEYALALSTISAHRLGGCALPIVWYNGGTLIGNADNPDARTPVVHYHPVDNSTPIARVPVPRHRHFALDEWDYERLKPSSSYGSGGASA